MNSWIIDTRIMVRVREPTKPLDTIPYDRLERVARETVDRMTLGSYDWKVAGAITIDGYTMEFHFSPGGKHEC